MNSSLSLPSLRAAVKCGVMLSMCYSLQFGYSQAIPITSLSTAGTLGASGAASTGVQNMIDGSFQANSFQQFKGPGSVTMDMGSVQAVDRLVVVGRFATGVPNLSLGTVEISSDGLIWTTVKTISNTESLGGGTSLALGFASQQARYVRLNLTVGASVNEQIGELQLYNGSGPRLSLIDRGSTFEDTTARTPFNLVDRNASTFVVYKGSTGSFTVRLDSVEYAEGWNALTLDGRSFAGNPSNPGKLTIFAGDDLNSLTSIYSESLDTESADWSYHINLDQTYNYKYLKVAWEKNLDWTLVQSNVQFYGVDVLPIPEPTTTATLSAGLLLIAGQALRKSHSRRL